MPPDERKATEDLLSGFDRTGRTPRQPPVEPASRPADLRAMPTVSVRPPSPSRAIWPWVGIGVVFLLTLGTVAMLALPDAPHRVESVPSVSVPIPSASPTPSIVVDIAPVTTVSTPAPTPSAPPRPAAPTPAPKPSDQRGDFVRSL